MNRLVRFILFITPGIILIILSVVLGWVVLPNIVDGQVKEQVRLVEGTDTWNKWKEAPIPIYLSFYIHHITNPDQVENGLKPIFVEKGPYVYLSKRKKVDIYQEDGPNTVKYKEVKTYFFDKERSGNNTESDLVNIPNLPFIAVLNTVRKMLPIDLVGGLVGNIILFQEELIRRNVPVRELLFDGFDVTKYTNSLLGSQLPKEFSGGRFGLYKGQNGTASKEWDVYTGFDSPDNFGRVRNWDGRNTLGFWRKYSECDKIKGSDGSLFHPFLTKESVLDIFSAEVCSSLGVKFKEEVVFKGITGYRFTTPKLNPKSLESRKCFCMEDKSDMCPLTGVLSLETCLKAPIFSSFPYFLDADIRYLAQSGLPTPDEEKHSTFIDLEPITGLLLRAHKRLQINLEVKSNRKVRALQALTQDSILFPVLWADENAELSDELINELQSTLFTPLQIISIGKWVALAIGILLFLIGLIAFIYNYIINYNPENIRKQSRLSSIGWRNGSGSAVAASESNSNGRIKSSEENGRRFSKSNRERVESPVTSSSSATSAEETPNDREFKRY